MKYLLAAVVVIGLTAVVGAVLVGTSVFDGTVVDNPYERGLAWDRELARQRDSGLQVDLVGSSFSTGANEVVIRILDARGEPLVTDGVKVKATRAASSAYDRTYSASLREDGTYLASVELPLRGRWDLIVVVEAEEGTVEFRRPLFARESGATRADAICAIDAGPCTTVIEETGVSVTLDISPRPVKSMAALDFTVALEGLDDPLPGKYVFIDLSMPGMFMGENIVRLRAAGDGSWSGAGVIVRCPSGKNIWRAAVSTPRSGTAFFLFEVDR
jgi:nitrogen fixation protein FixH